MRKSCYSSKENVTIFQFPAVHLLELGSKHKDKGTCYGQCSQNLSTFDSRAVTALVARQFTDFLPTGEVIVKIDMMDAFNTYLRII